MDVYYSSLNCVEDKPDHAHYRLLLWETSQNFSEVCEMRNRDISTLFLTFMKYVYHYTVILKMLIVFLRALTICKQFFSS